MSEWLTQPQLARRLGRSTRQLQSLAAAGLPLSNARGRPRYDWERVRPWWEQYLKDQVPRPIALDDARARKEVAQAELAEYELAEMRKQMIAISDVDRVLGSIQDRLRAKHMNIPGKWAPQLVGLRTIAEAQLRLEEIMQECLLELARVGDEIEDDRDTFAPTDPRDSVEPAPRKTRRRNPAKARAAP